MILCQHQTESNSRDDSHHCGWRFYRPVHSLGSPAPKVPEEQVAVISTPQPPLQPALGTPRHRIAGFSNRLHGPAGRNKDFTKAQKACNKSGRYYGHNEFGGHPNDSHRRRRSLCRTVRPVGGSPQEADAQVSRSFPGPAGPHTIRENETPRLDLRGVFLWN